MEEEEEDAAAGGAGSTDAFPPRAPGTVHLSMTVNQTVWDVLLAVACCHVVLSCLTVCLFVLSVGAVHGFPAHSCLLHLQLRKVRLYL